VPGRKAAIVVAEVVTCEPTSPGRRLSLAHSQRLDSHHRVFADN